MLKISKNHYYLYNYQTNISHKLTPTPHFNWIIYCYNILLLIHDSSWYVYSTTETSAAAAAAETATFFRKRKQLLIMTLQ